MGAHKGYGHIALPEGPQIGPKIGPKIGPSRGPPGDPISGDSLIFKMKSGYIGPHMGPKRGPNRPLPRPSRGPYIWGFPYI